ncbi:carotenoid biosynthesis protein [Paenibacillus sambharensis]|uniref:Carotenoid biosynthesis protein n=1 Tax=Paenibacillus sambharensis TaxID=1803190 RepID=A0A2W1L290_9BACL|nr:carotenoid biosynthesis protein [Paenibacillus sambharensis]PZD94078.1 carotenoid biosynthesis protein [Paenibacillus sambharensis]
MMNLPPLRRAGRRFSWELLRPLFWFWYAAGLLLMLLWEVPQQLQFSNGLFLIFFSLYAVYLVTRVYDINNRDRGSGLLLILAAAVTYAAEWIGTVTGWPFGRYAYTDTLRLFVEEVPVGIAMAWVGILSMSLLLARSQSRVLRALEVGGYALLLDLVLDPVAYARQFWIWLEPGSFGSFYGVPLQNFASWFTIAALLSLLFPLRAAPRALREEAGRLYIGMLLMFGLLAFKEDLWLAGAAAAAGALWMEGRLRLDRSRQEQVL